MAASRRGLPPELRKGLRKLSAVYVADRRKESRWSAKDGNLQNLYTRRRRRIDPEFEPSAATRKDILATRKALEAARIPPELWGKYLDFCFDWYPRFTSAPFPSTRMVSAAAAIERYAATHLATRFDLGSVAALLEEAGFGDQRGWVVLNLAKKVRGGAKYDFDDPRLGEAVSWLVEHFGRVAYTKEEKNAAEGRPGGKNGH